MSKLMTATALALALGAAGPALAQGAGQARGGEAMAQTQTTQPPASGSQAGASTPSTAAVGTAPWYGRFSADDLIGKDVVNTKGDEVGEIEDIVVDPSSRAMYAVVSVGGFLGIGDKTIAVPFEQLNIGAEDAILMSEQSESELKQLPAYDEGRYRPAERGMPLSPAND